MPGSLARTGKGGATSLPTRSVPTMWQMAQSLRRELAAGRWIARLLRRRAGSDTTIPRERAASHSRDHRDTPGTS